MDIDIHYYHGHAPTPCTGSLATKYARTDTRKNSFGLRVTEAWNKLDSETRNSATSKQFKARLKAKGRLAQ